MLYFIVNLIAFSLAYIIGSINSSIIAASLFGTADPRQFGSGNPGATNMLRSGNKKAALATLLGDVFKGWLITFVFVLLMNKMYINELTVALVGVGVVLGHIASFYLAFKGGKGVSTALGVLLALHPFTALVALIIFAVIFFVWRMVSLASISAAVVAVIVFSISSNNGVYALAILVIAIMVIYSHRANIKRIINFTEPRWGVKK